MASPKIGKEFRVTEARMEVTDAGGSPQSSVLKASCGDFPGPGGGGVLLHATELCIVSITLTLAVLVTKS